jgi:hypothetical protein
MAGNTGVKAKYTQFCLMKPKTVLSLGFALLAACAPYEPPESGIECARQFIDAAYQGNFKKAKKMLLNEADRNALESRIEKKFRKLNAFEKERLSKSSITILGLEALGADSLKVFFTNAYRQGKDSLLVLKRQEQWVASLPFGFQ